MQWQSPEGVYIDSGQSATKRTSRFGMVTTTAATTNRRKNATTTNADAVATSLSHSNNSSSDRLGEHISSSISSNRSNSRSADCDGGRGGDFCTAPTTRSAPAVADPRHRLTTTTMIYRIGWGVYLVSSFVAISLGVRENRTGRYESKNRVSTDRPRCDYTKWNRVFALVLY
jgi:hypothetical protein